MTEPGSGLRAGCLGLLSPALYLSSSYHSFTLSAKRSMISASPWDRLVPLTRGYSRSPHLQTIHTRAKPCWGLCTRTFFFNGQLGFVLKPHNNVFGALLIRFLKETQNASSKFLLNWKRQLSSLIRINYSILRFRMPVQVKKKNNPKKQAYSCFKKKTHSLDQHNNLKKKVQKKIRP